MESKIYTMDRNGSPIKNYSRITKYQNDPLQPSKDFIFIKNNEIVKISADLFAYTMWV